MRFKALNRRELDVADDLWRFMDRGWVASVLLLSDGIDLHIDTGRGTEDKVYSARGRIIARDFVEWACGEERKRWE